MPDSYLTSLPCPLPEDIAHLKGVGDYDMAIKLIDRRLETDIPQMLRTRLETERMFLQRLPRDYNLTDEQLLAEMAERAPGFTMEDLMEQVLDGRTDFIYLHGVRYFHEDTASSLFKAYADINARAKEPYDDKKPHLDAQIRRVMAGKGKTRIGISGITRIRDHAFVAGETYRYHLPVPARSMQQLPESITCEPAYTSIDDRDSAQRTLYLERKMDENTPVTFDYTYVQSPRYVNPMDERVHEIIYPDARPVCAEDLQEEAPHICFTPYLRALAAELKGDETDAVRIARKFYDFITTRVMYAYQRPYLLIEGGAEYTAVNLRGDCGLQAILFIALCRIAGIPARWQSGLYAAPGDIGSHDWAEFYSERLGWLPVDCSFGGGGKRAGSDLRWNFYFGNLEPWRMVANRRYYAPMAPAKCHKRFDPYDSQRGEIETETRGLYGGEFFTRYSMTVYEELED